MRKTHIASTSAATAIAAVLALSSTPLLAQQAQPTTDPAPPVATAPAPVADTTTPAPDTVPVPEVSTPVAVAKPTHRLRVAAKPAAVATKTVVKTTSRPVHAAAAATPAPAPAPAIAAATPAAPAARQAPIVDLTAKADKPAPAPVKAAQGTSGTDNAVMFGGGALALLALGGGAYALTRRKRNEDEALYEEQYETEAVAAAPVTAPTPRHDAVLRDEPAMIAPSAFAWDRNDQVPVTSDDGSDRRPGETWAERAERGPSPANPSASLRTRLKRAAFFDKREREVAEGKAVPVDADAGLPEAAMDEAEAQRELA